MVLSVSHPNVYLSDCRTNFVGAQEYLREIMHSWVFPKIQSTHSEKISLGFRVTVEYPPCILSQRSRRVIDQVSSSGSEQRVAEQRTY